MFSKRRVNKIYLNENHIYNKFQGKNRSEICLVWTLYGWKKVKGFTKWATNTDQFAWVPISKQVQVFTGSICNFAGNTVLSCFFSLFIPSSINFSQPATNTIAFYSFAMSSKMQLHLKTG